MRQTWNKRELRNFRQELIDSGFRVARKRGSHTIYVNDETGKTISVNKDLDKMVMQRLRKEIGLSGRKEN